MTVKGGTSQACAACKYQRRKCMSDCPLAPYFPPDKPRQFQNAHRLFGVSNILKILNKLDPARKPEAMRTIIYEANVRDQYPVHGCLGVICALHLQVQHAQLELEALHHHLSLLRHHYQQQQHQHQQQHQASSSSGSNEHYNVNDHGGGGGGGGGYLPFDAISFVDGGHAGRPENVMWAPVQPGVAAAAGSVPVHDYDEISPYFDALDEDRQPYIDTKEPYESSSDSTVAKEMVQLAAERVTENELKSAAACFTLTSVMN